MKLLSWYPRHDGYGWEKGAWVRLGTNGPGIVWTRERPLFSERQGIRRPFLRFRDWRFFWLGPVSPLRRRRATEGK